MAKRKSTKYGVIHVTASSPKTNLTQASLRAIHKAAGFSDIGYNEWISRDGKLHSGRAGGIDVVGAHVAGFNSISYGIALEGGVNVHLKGDISTITAAQWATLERRAKEVSKIFPGIEWCGHRDLSPDKNGNGIIEPFEYLKECPCFDAIPWAISKGLKGAKIRGTWAVTNVPDIQGPVFEGPDTRIAYLQRLLTRAGFLVVDDGIVGPKTKAAIKGFQQVHNIPTSANFDVETVALLREISEAPKASEEPKRGPMEGSEAAEKNTNSNEDVVVIPKIPPLPLEDAPAPKPKPRTLWDIVKGWFGY